MAVFTITRDEVNRVLKLLIKLKQLKNFKPADQESADDFIPDEELIKRNDYERRSI